RRKDERAPVVGNQACDGLVGLRVVGRRPRFKITQIAPVQRRRRVLTTRNKKAIPVNHEEPPLRRTRKGPYLRAVPYEYWVRTVAQEADTLPAPSHRAHRQVLEPVCHLCKFTRHIVAKPQLAAACDKQLRAIWAIKAVHAADWRVRSRIAVKRITSPHHRSAGAVKDEVSALRRLIWLKVVGRILQVQPAAEVIQNKVLLTQGRHQSHQPSGTQISRTSVPCAWSSAYAA